MTYEELFDILHRVTYKPKSYITITPGAYKDNSAVEIRISQSLPDVNAEKFRNGKCPAEIKHWDLRPVGMVKKIDAEDLEKLTPRTLLVQLREWLIEFEIHEVDEWLRYDGAFINDPHPEQRAMSAVQREAIEKLRALLPDRLKGFS